MDTEKTIISIIEAIIHDPEFTCGGIVAADKWLVDNYHLTPIQAAEIEIRLLKIFKYMKNLHKF